MRFAVGLTAHHPIPDALVSGDFLAELGRRAEAAGFDAVFFTEHPMPGDEWLHSGGHDALDPFVALAYVAAATTTLRLFTNLTVLPYRNPFLLAKAVATLDRVSGGRVILGAGVGCYGAQSQFYMTAYGDINPCDFNPINFGNVREMSIQEIWKKMVTHPDFSKRYPTCRMQSKAYRKKYIDPLPKDVRLPVKIEDIAPIELADQEIALAGVG